MTGLKAFPERDVAIIGGGLSGGLAALALADAGITSVLIDKAAADELNAPARDGRTTAIAYASARVFKRLGLWDDIAPEAGPIRDILVTEGRGRDRFRPGGAASAFLRFDARELENEDALGFIVENHVLRRAIYAGLARSTDVDVLAPAEVATLTPRDSSIDIGLLDGTSLHARLAVAADGRPSPARALMNIRTVEKSFRQTALTVIVRHERDHEGVAHELFTPRGPFAILPMTDNRASIVWTEETDAAGAVARQEPVTVERMLQDRCGEALGALHLDGPVVGYPLGLIFATRMAGDRFALLGDAAHGIHPIAGQGYNLAVKDVAAFAQVCGEAASAGLDIGAPDVLARYARARHFDNAAMAFGTDAINALFKNDFPPLSLARQAGVALVNRVPAARKFFMREAGGDVGALPPLMRSF